MLQIHPGMTLLDLGCGSGSVTVEMARMNRSGQVLALEQKREALELTRENLQRFAIKNVTLIEGRGEKEIKDLPLMDRVFIGGAGGALEEILNQLPEKMKPGGKILITAVTLETMTQAKIRLQSSPFTNLKILQTGITRYVPRAGYMMAQAENPVTIFCADLLPATQPTDT
ncbi:precorrin-6Y C5,15-methyltransferase (decarboxylating)/cobalt-precorrin-6B (C15)-methyltransferase [Tindallia californiensis]|uniref:Precorrin-6Y C5,15-methyltransferase (Decarboxylating)/cobalt-precorrin-6B (C15)-methyltransferase n=2 Tax=Tindallia californiensis TaxID=159292 RepID=A0A1H3PJG2_9FIRM|nr:precorrin-6Y C5,15-methyltransferase (decarboxylating)/cobalt-precorrin-6B (C15)-methyltransferase [Tindallia californiensis]